MKVVRFVDAQYEVGYGSRLEDGSVKRIAGDVFGTYEVTDETVKVKKLLAPVEPRAILAIGANYRAHIEESGKG